MFRIGDITVNHPFTQAALSGYSDLAMRLVARRHGASYALNEVVLDKTLLQKGKGSKRILQPVEPEDHPVGGQLMGADPADFAPAARMLVEAGYDVIDLNFACPVRKVLGRCRGGFLLSQPETARDILTSVLEAAEGVTPVTVKMRRGFDGSAESERNFFAVLDHAFERGIAGVTVHGRTVQQRYVGPSQWEFIGRVKKHVGDKLVLGSGDLFCARACLEMISATGVDAVAIARGAIGNPWIFAECLALASGRELPAPPSIPEQRATIAGHFAASVRVHGPGRAGRLMRKFGIKYSELHPCAREVRDAFVAVKTAAQFEAVLERWYDPEGDWPPVVRRAGYGDLIAAGARTASCITTGKSAFSRETIRSEPQPCGSGDAADTGPAGSRFGDGRGQDNPQERL